MRGGKQAERGGKCVGRGEGKNGKEEKKKREKRKKATWCDRDASRWQGFFAPLFIHKKWA